MLDSGLQRRPENARTTLGDTKIPILPGRSGRPTPPGWEPPIVPVVTQVSTEKMVVINSDAIPAVEPRPSNAATASLGSGKRSMFPPGRKKAFSRAFGILGLGSR